MPHRFQFRLSGLLILVTLAALIAWAATLFGIVQVGLALFLASPLLGGILLGKPLEGCLLSAFLLVVVTMGGFVAAGLLAD